MHVPGRLWNRSVCGSLQIPVLRVLFRFQPTGVEEILRACEERGGGSIKVWGNVRSRPRACGVLPVP